METHLEILELRASALFSYPPANILFAFSEIVPILYLSNEERERHEREQ